jgi:hypothetical protein
MTIGMAIPNDWISSDDTISFYHAPAGLDRLRPWNLTCALFIS